MPENTHPDLPATVTIYEFQTDDVPPVTRYCLGWSDRPNRVGRSYATDAEAFAAAELVINAREAALSSDRQS